MTTDPLGNNLEIAREPSGTTRGINKQQLGNQKGITGGTTRKSFGKQLRDHEGPLDREPLGKPLRNR